MAHAFNAHLLDRDRELAMLRELIAGAGSGGGEAGRVALMERRGGDQQEHLVNQPLAAASEAGCATASTRASELELNGPG